MNQPASPYPAPRHPSRPELPASLREEVDGYWERFLEAARTQALQPPAHPETLAVLHRVWAYSGFVAESCIAYPDMLTELLGSGDLLLAYPPGGFRHAVDTALEDVPDAEDLGRRLRHLRRREMVRIAWRDLAGWAPLEETLRELSWLAAAAVDGALQRLHRWLAAELGSPRGARSGEEQQLVVLGMGKLGADELNFSSDIDLILAYPEEGETRGRRARRTNEEFFSELGRRLSRTLSTPTEEGFVFRTDLRLRPYGDSGPLVMSFDQLEDYYQSQGREWERYALIKARPVAGELEQGQRLMETLRPFVYRRYLDFGVFESLREMKALIDREVARRELRDNIKLGPGGIREVEFIGQTFQLVRGGREPALRRQRILEVLRELTAAGHLPDHIGRELADAYRFLRRVENRVQMQADRQTHELPQGEHDRQRLAAAAGFEDWNGFNAALERHRRLVQNHFEQVFVAPQVEGGTARSGDETGPDFDALWRGSLATSEAQGTLTAAGFDDPEEALRRIGLLREGHTARALSTQGRGRLDRLLPLVIGAVANTDRPDVTLARVLELLERVARRTVYLALLAEHPVVLSQLVQLCEASPWIADLLAEQPLLLDELLDPRTLYAPLEREALAAELAAELAKVPADDLEQQMESLRHFKQTNVLRVAAADVMGAMPLMVVSDHLTEIAEVVLTEVLRLASGHMSQRRGRGTAGEPGRGFAIAAYGKLGGIELGYGSDLDLVFLHDDPDEEAATYHARLGQRIVHLLSAHTPAGVLYEVDVRLRPSGASGLLVSSLDAFEDYQHHQAWTWEHQALVRARVVAGDPRIARRFAEVRRKVLASPRDADALRREVREMRERMRTELARGGAERFDLKQDRGGIADIEFIVQYLTLRWAHRHPGLLRWTDNIRLLETLRETGALSAGDARTLTEGYRAYRQQVHRLALQEQEALVPADSLEDHRAAVTRIWREIMGGEA